MTIWETIYYYAVMFLQSNLFFVIKIFLAIYTTVLIVDVILLMYLSDIRKKLRELRMGTANIKTTKRGDLQKWNEIEKRLESDDEKQYRAAILEADKFTYEALELQGYSGGNFSERMAQIPAGSFESINIIMDVHDLSTKIIYDDKLRITKEQAENTLNVYRRFLKDIDVL